MGKIKNNNAIWNSRIKAKISPVFQKFGSSISIDKRLFNEDITASIAHVEMLYSQKIINLKVKNKIVWGLKKILIEIKKKKFEFKEQLEDIHMNIEKRLFEIIGDDAGFIHTARSRNDQVITDLKLWMRDSTNELLKLHNIIIKSFLSVAEKNIKTIMPGFTHLKNAQPISFAHYLLAYVEMFKRDKNRLKNNLEDLLENPLGVAALSGTSFNINRNYTTKKLKFNRPSKNSIDTVSNRDFVLDFLYANSVCAMHISRFAEEFIIWNSDAFDLITLKDNVVTGSSIMPQKKNPDPLEILRGKSGKSFGHLFSMLTILKGLPLSYFKDLQDDKELIFNSFDQTKSCLLILNEVLKNFISNKKKMFNLANKGHVTATDFADYLVKKNNYTFRNAYKITSELVNYCDKKNKKLSDLSYAEIKKHEPSIKNDVLDVFNLEKSVNSKKSYGGTSFDNIKKMIRNYKKEIK